MHTLDKHDDRRMDQGAHACAHRHARAHALKAKGSLMMSRIVSLGKRVVRADTSLPLPLPLPLSLSLSRSLSLCRYSTSSATFDPRLSPLPLFLSLFNSYWDQAQRSLPPPSLSDRHPLLPLSSWARPMFWRYANLGS
eukprot:2754004-Rhodomonas_salina.2